MEEKQKLPFLIRASIFFVGTYAAVAILYTAQQIIVPLIFAALVAVVLQPVVDFFVRRKINRLVAIVITLFLTFLIIAAFGVLVFSQARRFGASWPLLVDKFTSLLNQSITRISGYFNSDPQNIREWITQSKARIIESSSAAIGQTLVSVGSIVVLLVLVPVYVFMILFYQPLLLDFIHKLFESNHQTQVSKVVTQTKILIQRYLVGLVIEAAIMATLYSTTLFIVGIDYAILLGLVGALVNMIPYLGGIVGVALPVMVALATKPTGVHAFYVLGIYYCIQLVDNNFIVPKIVASKVRINALFSVIVVIAGNALWGIPGMFLSIPLLAIVKLFFDNIETMKSWGFLLGDTMPIPSSIVKSIFKKK